MGDPTGFTEVPTHYCAGDREAIDVIRENLGDHLFVGFCLGNVMKYTLRAGKKGDSREDLLKARWYKQMAEHVRDPNKTDDPRIYRSKNDG